MIHGSTDIVASREGITRIERRRFDIKGLVQGVGFRPFVYRLAAGLDLSGWVRNTRRGVEIDLEGSARKLEEFTKRLAHEKPRQARIDTMEVAVLPSAGHVGIVVRQSDPRDDRGGALVLPDVAVCEECTGEILNPTDRRYRYPFTNCTNCGPRFSIIEALPYDRANTTMNAFAMCEECRREYEDPLNRRFHAQPNACPECGPHLQLWDGRGVVLATRDAALLDACNRIRSGEILALKGLGGFQLLVDAGNSDAVSRLRRLKARRDKPFALMFPDLSSTGSLCEVTSPEEEVLTSPESPMVLLRRRDDADDDSFGISPGVAPENPYLAVMLPYTPLHHLLMSELGFPVVATSGNLAEEPICIDEHEALDRLGGIADSFLVHNRPIARQMDDSLVQVVAGREMVLRNARGYAPTTVPVGKPGAAGLAVGAHLKNAVAVGDADHVYMSQYIGDLTTPQAHDAFGHAVRSMSNLFGVCPEEVSCDEHPDYRSSRFAVGLGLPVTHVQHHFAHVLSCMAEHELSAPVLGVSWDGAGLGPDGTIWGGEFLRVADGSFTRAAHLRTFPLPGNEKAVREPRRSALGLLYEIFGERAFSMDNLKPLLAFDDTARGVLAGMLKRAVNAPRTSSAGRLFDAVASITGICQMSGYEGQAAMKLQFAASSVKTDYAYSFDIVRATSSLIIDWEPMIRGVLGDMRESVPLPLIAAKFHNTLAAMIVDIAGRTAEKEVVLTGGCFQNKRLLERTVYGLRAAGFTPYQHRRIPPNDGGIALGQIVAATNSPAREG